ncbi:pyridoxamine 5'-phosphate oxidase family protein [Kitasatospora sp. NBC_00315]|uniref:pyridoxamine 5'-phosphate oxidase family protein n=1 Tax=Kitasatospora sp. NBC_00315 TaxID=2975963 RepID=UPI0032456327
MDRDDRVECLSEDECLRLLATVPLGRLVYTAQALPAVLPVAFEVAADGRLVLAVRRDARVCRALDDTVTAFQADRLDPVTRGGWSVLVHGRSRLVSDPATHERLLRSGTWSWAPEDEPVFVTITPELVGGNRLRPVRRPGADACPAGPGAGDS